MGRPLIARTDSMRLQRFHALASHVVIGKAYKRLSKHEVRICEQFILENDHLDRDAFAFRLNRLFLDQPIKPRHHVDIWALIMQSQ